MHKWVNDKRETMFACSHVSMTVGRHKAQVEQNAVEWGRDINGDYT
jgi:hypothetical protein